MPKAIILAAHGSTRPEPLAALQRFQARAMERHPGLPCRLAYTSRHVLGRMPDAGSGPPRASRVLDELAGQGVDRVVLQSLHVIPGREFHELTDLADKARASGRFARIEIGRPLLDSERDAERAARALLDAAPDHSGPGRAVLFMGHGTHHEGNQAYAMLDAVLRRRDPSALIGTMKGELDLDAVLARLADLDVDEVHLLPLFFGAGAHAEDDMAGDGAESWESRLKDAGIRCTTLVQGGADWDSLADIWLDHLDAALERLG